MVKGCQARAYSYLLTFGHSSRYEEEMTKESNTETVALRVSTTVLLVIPTGDVKAIANRMVELAQADESSLVTIDYNETHLRATHKTTAHEINEKYARARKPVIRTAVHA